MGEENGLVSNSIGLWGVIFYSISVISPAFTFTVGAVASIYYSGSAAPLTYLIAGLATFSAVIAIYVYSRYVNNSGGYFKFIEAATQKAYISKTIGLWYLSSIIGAIIMGGGVVAWFANSALEVLFNLALPIYALIALSLIVPILFFIIGYFRVKSAAKTAITVGLLQIVTFSAISIAFLVRSHYNGDLLVSITKSTNGLHGFFLAMILGAFFSYAGYGSVVSLGEEVKFSKDMMKKAIVYALVIMVAFETFAVYSIVALAGPNISALGSSFSPSLYLGKLYFGTYVSALIFAVGLIGIVFSLVLSGNSGARYAFALARDGVLPSNLGKIHKHYGSPYVAVFWTFIISTVGIVVTEYITILTLGYSSGLFYAWAIWGTVLMFFSLVLSTITNTSLVFFIKRMRSRVKVLSHVIGPSISSMIMILALGYSLFGLKSPMSSVYLIILSIVIIDVAIFFLRRKSVKVDAFTDLISR